MGNFKLWAHNAVMFQSLVQYKEHTLDVEVSFCLFCFFLVFLFWKAEHDAGLFYFLLCREKVPGVFLSEHFNALLD